jgi:hypothetical protein
MNTIPGTDIEKPVVEGPVDGNAFAIMGAVKKALQRAKVPSSIIKEYFTKAVSSDYNNLLRVSMEYVEFDL